MYGFYRTFIGCLCLLTLLVTNIGTLKAREYDPIINFDKVWEYSLFNTASTRESRLHVASYMKFDENPFLIQGTEYYRFYEFERNYWRYPDYSFTYPCLESQYGDSGYGYLMREEGARLYFLINRNSSGKLDRIGEFEFDDGNLKNAELYNESDFEEVMLYDFSLEGESSYFIEPFGDEIIICQVNEENVYGHSRIHQYCWSATIAEGIGPTTIGVLYFPFVDFALSSPPQTSCSYKGI